MKYQYHATQPFLPPPELRENPHTPLMDNQDMEYWLNLMDERGWEFVGFGSKQWLGNAPVLETWWVFRKPRPKIKETEKSTDNKPKYEINPCENDNCESYSNDFEYNCCHIMNCNNRD